jgi:hypothetical protein
MNTKERFLNLIDGVLLTLAMVWTLTIAIALFHPTSATSNPTALRAAITDQAGNL